MMKKGAVVLVVFIGIVPAWGVGRAAEPAAPAEAKDPAVATVQIVIDAAGGCDRAYEPSVITVKAGTTVEWINQDYESHSLISSRDGNPCRRTELPPEARLMDAGSLLPRARYRLTFERPGEYPYTCHLPFHRMGGKVIVVP